LTIVQQPTDRRSKRLDTASDIQETRNSDSMSMKCRGAAAVDENSNVELMSSNSFPKDSPGWGLY